MSLSKTFLHQDYEFQCSAQPVDSGKFAPGLVVSKQVWPTRPRTIAVQRGDHVSEATAIDAAFAQGVEWVRDYG
jgi:hypothetical protein